MNPPIIFIHQGPLDWLAYSLVQAKKSSPDTPVVLIFNNTEIPPEFNFLELVSLQDVAGSAREFAKIYKHFSINKEEFELFCMQRWFVLQEFARRMGVECFIHLDSDVMCYCNAREIYDDFHGSDAALSRGHSAHTSIFYSLRYVDELCNAMLDFYGGVTTAVSEYLQVYIDKFKVPSPDFNMCDMGFMEALHSLAGMNIADVSAERLGAVYDHNINSSQPGNFKMENDKKFIAWLGAVPFGVDQTDSRLVRFKSLHFQGNAKGAMPAFLR